jgi:hypothetical protein
VNGESTQLRDNGFVAHIGGHAKGGVEAHLERARKRREKMGVEK